MAGYGDKYRGRWADNRVDVRTVDYGKPSHETERRNIRFGLSSHGRNTSEYMVTRVERSVHTVFSDKPRPKSPTKGFGDNDDDGDTWRKTTNTVKPRPKSPPKGFGDDDDDGGMWGKPKPTRPKSPPKGFGDDDDGGTWQKPTSLVKPRPKSPTKGFGGDDDGDTRRKPSSPVIPRPKSPTRRFGDDDDDSDTWRKPTSSARDRPKFTPLSPRNWMHKADGSKDLGNKKPPPFNETGRLVRPNRVLDGLPNKPGGSPSQLTDDSPRVSLAKEPDGSVQPTIKDSPPVDLVSRPTRAKPSNGKLFPPTDDIAQAMEYLREAAGVPGKPKPRYTVAMPGKLAPDRYSKTIDSREAERRNGKGKPPPETYGGGTITSEEAVDRYRGRRV